MRLTLIVVSALFLVAPRHAVPQHRPGHKRADFRLASCPVADTLLGAPGDEPGSLVGDYAPGSDSVRLAVGDLWNDGVRIEVYVGAHDPLPYPEATAFVLVRGDGARAVAVPAPYDAVLAIDDSTYPLGPARPGRHSGPVEQAGAGFTIELGSLALLKLALATKADLRVGLATVTLGKRVRRGTRALYRAALCGLKSSDRP